MAEIPVPEEVISEANYASNESQPIETEKNNNDEKLFDDFRASPEYARGLEKHRQEVKPGINQETAVRGYEAQMTTPENPLVGTGENYKVAFLNYVGEFYEKHGVWPLYFSKESVGEEAVSAYDNYKEAATKVNAAQGRTDVVSDADLDTKRSESHDRLAEIIYNQGRVKTFLDGKLVARMWLVGDRIEGPASITFMDKARILRDFNRVKNSEMLGSK